MFFPSSTLVCTVIVNQAKSVYHYLMPLLYFAVWMFMWTLLLTNTVTVTTYMYLFIFVIFYLKKALPKVKIFTCALGYNFSVFGIKGQSSISL